MTAAPLPLSGHQFVIRPTGDDVIRSPVSGLTLFIQPTLIQLPPPAAPQPGTGAAQGPVIGQRAAPVWYS